MSAEKRKGRSNSLSAMADSGKAIPVDILSEQDEDPLLDVFVPDSVSPLPKRKSMQRSIVDPPSVLILVDDSPIPPKTSSLEIPYSENSEGISKVICLESEDEQSGVLSRMEIPRIKGGSGLRASGRAIEGNYNSYEMNCGDARNLLNDVSSPFGIGRSRVIDLVEDSPSLEIFKSMNTNTTIPQVSPLCSNLFGQSECDKNVDDVFVGDSLPEDSEETDGCEKITRKKQLKEEKTIQREEKKRKRQEDKLAKEAMKAEEAKVKKFEQEMKKWEKGKFALKSIVAEVDTRVIENGSIGGHLLSRFAEKGISFRITSNQIEGSILWKLNVPDELSQLSSVGSEVQYILLVFEAEEFCKLTSNGAILDHVRRVQRCYPSFTVCYLTNKLISYITKWEQNQFKTKTTVGFNVRPPVEEVLSKFTTHYTRVHSRLCLDEADVADHIVGLTCSLATCQFRKKISRLSVNANGSLVSKDFVDRRLVKRSIWMRALVTIPKVQPRFAIAIWKKYPTMKSLLDVYMDPSKTVHEKEFLLQDLPVEGLVGGERRLGEACSKRVYRILMARNGAVSTDDAESGADFFSS